MITVFQFELYKHEFKEKNYKKQIIVQQKKISFDDKGGRGEEQTF